LIDPNCFAGGEIHLDMALAVQGIDQLAKKLGLDRNQTAYGILTIARDNMTTATGEILIGQGFDPRDFAIMSFGGGGGLFATGIARDMGISKVIIPPNPGVFCAWGMLTMNLVHSYSQTYFRPMAALDMRELESIYQDMEKRGLETLNEEKIAPDAIESIRSLDICYEGQGHYVEVPWPESASGEAALLEIIGTFHRLHKIKYGHQMEASPRVINVRLKAIGKAKEMQIRNVKQDKNIPSDAIKPGRTVYLGGNYVESRIYDRYKMLGGNSVNGPAIIEEPFHVTVVMPGQTLLVDNYGNLIITIGGNKNQ